MIVTGFSSNVVYLVDPSVDAYYSNPDLQPIYSEVISALRGRAAVKVLSRSPVRWEGAENIVIDRLSEIWIRDFGVIQCGRDFYVPDYHPNYLYKPEHQPSLDSAPAFRTAMFPNAKRLPLVLDIGNFVCNGRVAIITDMVFKQNPGLSRSDVENRLAPLNLDSLFVIPKEPYDDTGHADGTLCFLDEETLVVGDYERSASYQQRLDRQLRRLAQEFDIVHLPGFGVADPNSAEGCYVNLLNLPDVILLPVFEHPNDDKVYSLITKHTKKSIVPIDCRNLAKYGGALHCITCTTREGP